MTKMIENNIGSMAVAGALIILTAIGSLFAMQGLSMWQKQQKAEAIDGCFASSNYTQSTAEEVDGKQVTRTDSFPIAWMFTDCMKNKGYDEGYTRTDFGAAKPSVSPSPTTK